MQPCLLILLLAPSLEDAIVDFLLAQPEIHGFTSSKASGHGVEGAQLNLVEQVTGRQQRLQIMVQGNQEHLSAMIAAMQQQFAAADIYCVLLPVLQAGHLAAFAQDH